MSIENKIKLLWESAKTLENGQQTHRLLKSYYINTCRKLCKNSLLIPKEKFAISIMCPYCGSFWNDSEFGLKLLPKQFKNTSKSKKLIEKFDNNSNCTTGSRLTRKQRNRAKWLKKKISNNIAVKCCLCKHTSLVKIGNLKSKYPGQLPKNNNEHVSCDITEKVQEVKILNLNSTAKKSEIVKVDDKPIKKARFKNKTKSKNTSSKVISKTQHQNSLLQLAALLQKQSKSNLKNCTEKKLKSFLK